MRTSEAFYFYVFRVEHYAGRNDNRTAGDTSQDGLRVTICEVRNTSQCSTLSTNVQERFIFKCGALESGSRLHLLLIHAVTHHSSVSATRSHESPDLISCLRVNVPPTDCILCMPITAAQVPRGGGGAGPLGPILDPPLIFTQSEH